MGRSLALKEWILKVSEKMLLLKYIDAIDRVAVSASGSADVSVANLEHLLLIGAGAGNSKVMAIVNGTSSGAVSYLKVAGATNMTFTTATNKITINNGYNYAMGVLVVRF